MKREDLIGKTGTILRSIAVVDAKEEGGEVEVRVLDERGNEYWAALDGDIDLD